MNERAVFSSKDFTEATVTIPEKLSTLQKETQNARDRIMRLRSLALHTAVEIATGRTGTDDRFLDISLVLASYLAHDLSPYHQDKTLEATKEIYSRLTQLDIKLKENHSQPILLDRTIMHDDSRIDLSIDLGQLNRSPSINYDAFGDRSLSSNWFWHEVARSIRINLEGYRKTEHVDNAWHPPMTQIWSNPNYQNQWFSEDITGFFQLDNFPHYDYNGLKKDLFGEPIKYIGGIFIGKEEILDHFRYTLSSLVDDRNKNESAKNQLALKPILESAMRL